MTYLTPDHADAHVDFPALVKSEAIHTVPKDHVQCPACKGYGGHNLMLNAYPLPNGEADTPANRYRYVHFRSSCSQCTGWGYVRIGLDSMCVHSWDRGKNIGRCLTLYTCQKCKRRKEVDSSD